MRASSNVFAVFLQCRCCCNGTL